MWRVKLLVTLVVLVGPFHVLTAIKALKYELHILEGTSTTLKCPHSMDVRVRWEFVSAWNSITETIFDSMDGKHFRNDIDVFPQDTYSELFLGRVRKESSGRYICMTQEMEGEEQKKTSEKSSLEVNLIVRGINKTTMVAAIGSAISLPCENEIMDVSRMTWRHTPLEGKMRKLQNGAINKIQSRDYWIECGPNLPCSLKIFAVSKESAGSYICMDGDSLEYDSKNSSGIMATELVAVEDLKCNEVKENNFTFLGENDCGMEADALNLKCSLSYYGNTDADFFNLVWIVSHKLNSLAKESILPQVQGEVIRETNVISIRRSLPISSDMVNFTFKCVLKDVDVKSCQLNEFRVQYVINATSMPLSVYTNDLNNFECSINKSEDIQCTYEWVHKSTGARFASFDIGADHSIGRYDCQANCSLEKLGICLLKAMEIEVVKPYTVGSNSPCSSNSNNYSDVSSLVENQSQM